MRTKPPTRREIESRDPAKARKEAAAALQACEGDEARLAELRERESLARLALYDCEFSRLTRELAKATREREDAERDLQRRRKSQIGKLRRNADPAIDRTFYMLLGVWDQVRQSGTSQTGVKGWARIRQQADTIRAAIEAVDALKYRDEPNVEVALRKILAPFRLDIPPASAPIDKLDLQDQDYQ